MLARCSISSVSIDIIEKMAELYKLQVAYLVNT